MRKPGKYLSDTLDECQNITVSKKNDQVFLHIFLIKKYYVFIHFLYLFFSNFLVVRDFRFL